MQPVPQALQERRVPQAQPELLELLELLDLPAPLVLQGQPVLLVLKEFRAPQEVEPRLARLALRVQLDQLAQLVLLVLKGQQALKDLLVQQVQWEFCSLTLRSSLARESP